MVVPIRDIGNKFCSISALSTSTANMTYTSDMDMVIDNVNAMSKNNYNNYNEVRSYMLTPNSQRFRFLSMSSKLSKEEYIIRVQHKSNRMVEDKQNVPFNSPLLEYAMQRNQTKQVSEATNNMNNMGQQHVQRSITIQHQPSSRP